MLNIGSISERWIFITSASYDEPDELIDLVREYQAYLSGKIVAVPDDMQYTIDNDPLKLIFQWDSFFGITVITPDNIDMATAEKALQDICNRLNSKQK